jgi:hypothetical protein
MTEGRHPRPAGVVAQVEVGPLRKVAAVEAVVGVVAVEVAEAAHPSAGGSGSSMSSRMRPPLRNAISSPAGIMVVTMGALFALLAALVLLWLLWNHGSLWRLRRFLVVWVNERGERSNCCTSWTRQKVVLHSQEGNSNSQNSDFMNELGSEY